MTFSILDDDIHDIGDYVLANSPCSSNSVYIPPSNGTGVSPTSPYTNGSPNITPGTTTNPTLGGGGIVTYPNINWPQGPIASTIGSYTYNLEVATYTILKLPRKKMPEKVFVQGLLKTCGLLGTDAECAYTDKDTIIFAPNVIPISDPNIIVFFGNNGTASTRGPTISIEYYNAIYHYVVDNVPVKGDKSTILDVRQVGMVKKGK